MSRPFFYLKRMHNYLAILTFLSLGFLLKRIKSIPENTGTVLNLIVIYISLPALILLKVPTLKFSWDLLVPTFLPWILLLVSVLLIGLCSYWFKWNRNITGALLLVVPLGNTSFLGIPMVQSFFGEQGIPYALIYDQLGSFLALVLYGSLILVFYGEKENKPTLGAILQRIISFPPFLALLLALLVKNWLLSSEQAKVILETLAATLVPLVMIAVGFQFTLRLKSEEFSKLLLGLGIKMLIIPLVAWAGCKLLALEGLAVQVSIFEAAMPPMVSAGALAIIAGLAPELVSALIAVGIFLSFITLPLFYQLLM